MTTQKPTSMEQVVALVRSFLSGKIDPGHLVMSIDDLASNDKLVDLDPASAALVDQLHLTLALYTPDEKTRLEEPRVLVGRDALARKAAEFDAAARGLGY